VVREDASRLVGPDICSTEQLMRQARTVALQGMCVPATCMGERMGTGCSDGSLCHTHFVSEQTWTCCDLKVTFCSPSQTSYVFGKGGGAGCQEEKSSVLYLVCALGGDDTNLHTKGVNNHMNTWVCESLYTVILLWQTLVCGRRSKCLQKK